ncbi:MAG: nitroreductase [Myxococcales bacterium]|nr:nitroreductase [Myxococcales bacterium]
MELSQALEQRCSVRRFKDDPIPPAVLQRVLEAARRAPSWANAQPARWIVVTDPAIKAKLAPCLSPGNPSSAAILKAPVVLALCFVKKRSGYYKGTPSTSLGDWGLFDAGLAAANLSLAAVAEGLGTVHVGAINLELAAETLQVPADVQLVELIPLGYPEQWPNKTTRLELEKIVSHEKYGS